MSAPNQGGKADAPALRRGRAASRQPDRSQVITLARSAGRGVATAFACKPEQLAYAVRWLVATAALARTDRWPFPEVKTRIPQVLGVRGSRASTDPKIPPDLLNPPKGLSMAKTARVSLQLVRKFVPAADSLQSAHLPQTTPGETVIQRGYTLCEVSGMQEGRWPTIPSMCRIPYGLLHCKNRRCLRSNPHMRPG